MELEILILFTILGSIINQVVLFPSTTSTGITTTTTKSSDYFIKKFFYGNQKNYMFKKEYVSYFYTLVRRADQVECVYDPNGNDMSLNFKIASSLSVNRCFDECEKRGFEYGALRSE